MASGRTPKRKSKLTDISEAINLVSKGSQVAIGGGLYHNVPCAFIRTLIRSGLSDLKLFSCPVSSYGADLLLGSGAVSKAYLPNVTFEYMGLAPCYRASAEKGLVELIECDESTILGGYIATIESAPYQLVGGLKGSDLAKVTPLLTQLRDRDGREFMAALALSPDVAIVHMQEADEFGNCRNFGMLYSDVLMAKASKTVIVTTDRVVGHRSFMERPWLTTLPSYIVDAVVEVPFGAHPTSSVKVYVYDEEHLREYLRAAEAKRKDPDSKAFQDYLNRYVIGVEDHYEYLERIGGIRKLTALMKESDL